MHVYICGTRGLSQRLAPTVLLPLVGRPNDRHERAQSLTGPRKHEIKGRLRHLERTSATNAAVAELQPERNYGLNGGGGEASGNQELRIEFRAPRSFKLHISLSSREVTGWEGYLNVTSRRNKGQLHGQPGGRGKTNKRSSGLHRYTRDYRAPAATSVRPSRGDRSRQSYCEAIIETAPEPFSPFPQSFEAGEITRLRECLVPPKAR